MLLPNKFEQQHVVLISSGQVVATILRLKSKSTDFGGISLEHTFRDSNTLAIRLQLLFEVCMSTSLEPVFFFPMSTNFSLKEK